MTTQTPESLHIGWIGTGVMGGPMALHLLNAGHQLKVYTRSPQKASDLLDSGATWAATPAEATTGTDVACSMVGLPSDVEAIYFGEGGVLSAKDVPPLLIDFTTSTPSLAERLAEKATSFGSMAVDAPVSGGDVGAKNATLSIMVGGSDAAVRTAASLFEILGSRFVHQGSPGAGQHTKMVNQILIASMMLGVCEGLLYAAKAGLDPDRVIESVGGGAAGSWSINQLGPRINKRDFEPGFFIEHFIKDLDIALQEAHRLQLELPGLSLARKFYEQARTMQLDRKGTQALMLVYEQMHASG